jgi:hypothetical protein
MPGAGPSVGGVSIAMSQPNVRTAREVFDDHLRLAQDRTCDEDINATSPPTASCSPDGESSTATKDYAPWRGC